ncbi:MAG: hypothetical protein HQL69_19105 [Magnetococcales bacterium]|nr:hypothetical protein [Magnetococcales bacterium]
MDTSQVSNELNSGVLKKILHKSGASPNWSFYTAIVLVFVVEGVIMLIMPELKNLSHIEMALLDSTFLVIFLLPALYLIIYKPLAEQKAAIQKAEQRLQVQLSHSLELKESLLTKSRELTTANNSLESFIYLTAHDLRTPLRTLNGFSEILLEEYSEKLDDKGRSYLYNLRDGSQNMHAMLEGMLTLSRSMQAKLTVQKVDLSKLVQNCVRHLQDSSPKRRVSVLISPNIIAYGDESLLQTVVEELLENAWKFTAHNPDAQIEFTTSKIDSQTIFKVRDNGAGFDIAHKDMLFRPFFLLHKTDEFEGIGVGLALCQTVIERHGGTIWAEAEVGQGATFMFTLNHDASPK